MQYFQLIIFNKGSHHYNTIQSRNPLLHATMTSIFYLHFLPLQHGEYHLNTRSLSSFWTLAPKSMQGIAAQLMLQLLLKCTKFITALKYSNDYLGHLLNPNLGGHAEALWVY